MRITRGSPKAIKTGALRTMLSFDQTRRDSIRRDAFAVREVSRGLAIIHPRECLVFGRHSSFPGFVVFPPLRFFSRQSARVSFFRVLLLAHGTYRHFALQPTSSPSTTTTWKQRQRQRAIKGLIDVNSKGN